MALSGGNSPRPLFKLLAQPPYLDQLPWHKTWVLWSDERYVPLDDDRSNAGHAMKLLLEHVPIPPEQILAIYKDGAGVDEAAALYESEVRGLLDGDAPRLDMVLLGCGTDGHTASLFPGNPVLSKSDALVRAVKPAQSDIARVTMTLPLLNQARSVVFIVTGEAKADIVHRILEDSEPLPAGMVQPVQGELLWLLDSEAASKLQPQ